jgi:hypothetical protein
MISFHLGFGLVRSISCSICSNTASVRRSTSSFQNRRTVIRKGVFDPLTRPLPGGPGGEGHWTERPKPRPESSSAQVIHAA